MYSNLCFLSGPLIIFVFFSIVYVVFINERCDAILRGQFLYGNNFGSGVVKAVSTSMYIFVYWT